MPLRGRPEDERFLQHSSFIFDCVDTAQINFPLLSDCQGGSAILFLKSEAISKLLIWNQSFCKLECMISYSFWSIYPEMGSVNIKSLPITHQTSWVWSLVFSLVVFHLFTTYIFGERTNQTQMKRSGAAILVQSDLVFVASDCQKIQNQQRWLIDTLL